MLVHHGLQTGNLVFGQVVKALPDRQASLICLTTHYLAVLPHEHRDRTYKVGDTLAATVLRATPSGYPILSQRCSQYIRKIADLLLAPLVQARRVKIRAVAMAQDAPFVKVAVELLDGEDPMGECLHRLVEFKHYLTPTVVLIRYDEDLSRYIANALTPAPRHKIRQVVLLPATRSAQVTVEPGAARSFLGFKGLNVAVANKLVKRHIDIVECATR